MNENAHVPSHDPLTSKLALAGIAAPIIFIASVIAQGFAYADYSHVAQPISALAAWPDGWIQILTFIITGALMIVFAMGLHRAMAAGRGGVAGPAFLLLSGLGLIVAGVFPWRLEGGAFIEPAGHIAGSLAAFVGGGLGLIVLSLRMTADPVWRDIARPVRGAGIATLALFGVFAALALPEDGPLHPWLGAVQRVTVGVWFAGVLVLAVRLLHAERRDRQH